MPVPVLREMEALLAEGGGVLAIDGRCGSGKSSLGGLLARLYPCTLVHMDDFYMPPEGRQENWMEIPAGISKSIILNVRLPRVLNVALVGAALSLCGAALRLSRPRPYSRQWGNAQTIEGSPY